MDGDKLDNQWMNFGEALAWLKDGHKIARKGWNGKDMYLKLQTPDEHSKMTLPYIYMSTAVGYDVRRQCVIPGKLVPWLASQTDMLSEDWMIVT